MTIAQPSNVSNRTTQVNGAGITTVTGDGYYLPYLPNVAQQTSMPQFFMTSYPLRFSLLDAVGADTTEPVEMQVMGRNYHAVQVSGTFTATVLVESTLDGTNWTTLSSITTEGVTQYANSIFQSIRVSVTNYTSGNVTVVGLSMRS